MHETPGVRPRRQPLVPPAARAASHPRRQPPVPLAARDSHPRQRTADGRETRKGGPARKPDPLRHPNGGRRSPTLFERADSSEKCLSPFRARGLLRIVPAPFLRRALPTSGPPGSSPPCDAGTRPCRSGRSGRRGGTSWCRPRRSSRRTRRTRRATERPCGAGCPHPRR